MEGQKMDTFVFPESVSARPKNAAVSRWLDM